MRSTIILRTTYIYRCIEFILLDIRILAIFKCLVLYYFIFVSFSGLTENARVECGATSECPHPCRCADGIVDCREKSLTNVPYSLPDDTTELY